MATHKAILATNNFNEFLDTLVDNNRKSIIIDKTSDLYSLMLNQYCLLRYLSGEIARAKNTWLHFRVDKLQDIQSKVREWEEFAIETTTNHKKREQEFHSTISKLNKDSDLLDFEHAATRTRPVPKKLNICELLENQIGKEFYCSAYGYVELIRITRVCITFRKKDQTTLSLESTGAIINYNGECIIFPSKEQRDWSKYNPCEFADGELVWVKDVESNDWLAAYHTGHTKLSEHDGIYHECYQNQKKEGKTLTWRYCIKFEPKPF